jgi:hypothetical protein
VKAFQFEAHILWLENLFIEKKTLSGRVLRLI